MPGQRSRRGQLTVQTTTTTTAIVTTPPSSFATVTTSPARTSLFDSSRHPSPPLLHFFALRFSSPSLLFRRRHRHRRRRRPRVRSTACARAKILLNYKFFEIGLLHFLLHFLTTDSTNEAIARRRDNSGVNAVNDRRGGGNLLS